MQLDPVLPFVGALSLGILRMLLLSPFVLIIAKYKHDGGVEPKNASSGLLRNYI